MQEQAVERHGFGLQDIELDLGELAFLDFAPAVDTRLGFLNLAAIQSTQELAGVVARSGLTNRGASEGFDGVAAQKLAPVVFEEIAGGEDVAPSDFAAVSDDPADGALILQA